MKGFYKLVDGKPVATSFLNDQWCLGSDDWLIKRTTIKGILISTVFLGLEHGCRGGKPLLWETMIFRDGKGCEMIRATSKKQALRHHYALVAKIRRVENGKWG